MDSRRRVVAIAFLLWNCCCCTEARMTSESSRNFGSRTRLQLKQNEAEEIPDDAYLHLKQFSSHRDSVPFESETGESQEEEEEDEGIAGPWNPERKRGKKLSFSDFYVSRGKKLSPDVFYVSRGKRDFISDAHSQRPTSGRRLFEDDGQRGSKHRHPHILERSEEEEEEEMLLGGRGSAESQHLMGEAIKGSNGPSVYQKK